MKKMSLILLFFSVALLASPAEDSMNFKRKDFQYFPDTLSQFLLNNAIHDTLKINQIFEFVTNIQHPDSTKKNNDLIEEAIGFSLLLIKDEKSSEHLIRLLGRKGKEKKDLYDFKSAILWFQKQIQISDSLGNFAEESTALNNLGLIYRRMNQYEKAIDAYQNAIQLADKSSDKYAYVTATSGLGKIYLELDNLSEAMQSFRTCLEIEQKQSDLQGVANSLNNIGKVYLKMNEIEKGLEYFMLSLEINREIGSTRGIAICYDDLGDVYKLKNENDKALNYFLLSLQLNTSIDDLYYLAINNVKAAEIYVESGDLSSASNHVVQGIDLSKKTGNRLNLMKAYKLMYQIQKDKGNIEKAIYNLELATVLNDSILNENTQRTIFQMQATFNRERTENEIALLQNEKQIADLRIKRQTLFGSLIAIGLLLLIVAFIVLIIVLRFKERANNLLKSKNIEIEENRNKISEYAEKLLVAVKEAEQSNQLKSQFLANMSHEIRTPLNSVLGFSEILANTITDPKQLSYLDAIRSSGRSLLVLINDILDLSKIESGKMQIEPHPTDLRAVASEVKQVFTPQISEKGLVFEIYIDEDLPKILLLNEASVRQILFNLVGNALKFTSQGSISLFISSIQIDEDLFDIKIRVEDTGRGVEEKDQENIFDAFFQSNYNNDFHKGTGLGLTITKRLVEAMNGKIDVSSNPGIGSIFFINFSHVKSVPIRTALRLFEFQSANNITPSSIRLISCDLSMQIFIDGLIIDSVQTCDIFELSDLINIKDIPRYKNSIWDISELNKYDFEDYHQLLRKKGGSSRNILLFSEKNELNNFHLENFDALINVPTDSSKLKLILFGNDVEKEYIRPDLKKDLQNFGNQNFEDEKLQTLFDAFQTAKKVR
jgi:signal transduction histidine kinase/Tfp pilus assembly protein PilF